MIKADENGWKTADAWPLPSSSAGTVGPFTRRPTAAEYGFRIGIEQAAISVIESFQFDPGNFLADEVLDRRNLLQVFGRHDRKRVTDVLGAPRATDAVDVVFRVMRHVEIDHVADLLDVDAARGDIGGDHDFVSAVAKSAKRAFALALRAARVQHRHRVALLMQLARDAVGPVFRAAENQHLIVVGAPQQFF